MAQKNIKVPFPIPVSEKGRIKANDAKKLLKYLATEHLLKVGMDYFVTDSTGHEEMWTFQKSMDWDHDYEFSCEVFDDDRDFYNCLYFDKKSGKIDYKSCEYEAHLVECAKKGEKMEEATIFEDLKAEDEGYKAVFTKAEELGLKPSQTAYIDGRDADNAIIISVAERKIPEELKAFIAEKGLRIYDYVFRRFANGYRIKFSLRKDFTKLAYDFAKWYDAHYEDGSDLIEEMNEVFEQDVGTIVGVMSTEEAVDALSEKGREEIEKLFSKALESTKEMNESTSKKAKKLNEAFNGARFERHIPSNMRYKHYDVVDGDLYWVTQEPFDEMDEIDFAKALGAYTPYKYAYVICRDASRGYERDMNSPYIHEIAAADDVLEDLHEAEEPKSYILKAEGPYFDYTDNPYYNSESGAWDATIENATRFDQKHANDIIDLYDHYEIEKIADDREPNWMEYEAVDYSVFSFNSYEEYRDFCDHGGFNDFNASDYAVYQFGAYSIEEAEEEAQGNCEINILCIEHDYNDHEPIKCQINGGEWKDWADVDPVADFPSKYDWPDEEEEELEESVTLEVYDKEGRMIDRQPGFRSSNEAKAFVDENDDQYPAGYRINIRYNESVDDEFEKYYHPTVYEDPEDFDWRGDEIRGPEYNIEDDWLEEAPELEYEPVEEDLTDLYARNELAEELGDEVFEESQKLHDSIKLKESSKKYFEKLGVRK